MVVLLTSLLLTSLVAWPAAPIHGVRAAAAAVVMLEGKAPPLKLLNLMCQCTVQAQLGYYAEFKNEVRSRWLESFLGHEHLRVERTGAMTTRLLYRGLSDGMRCSWRDYLATMLRGKPEQYEVRYAVGTADAATMPRVPRPEQPPDDVATEAAAAAPAAAEGEAPSTQAAAASAGSAEAAKAAWLARSDGRAPAATPPPSSAKPWAAASASRAANPFLLKADRTYLEYTELLEPRRIATGLISIAQQLAHEWSEDLAHLTREGDYLSEVYASEADSCLVNSVGGDDAPPATLMSELGSTAAAARDVSKALPSILYASLSAASAAWVSDLNEAGISPFRAENYDLLQRALTREAALSALAELEQARAAPAFPLAPESSSHAASAIWLRERLEAYAVLWEAPPRNQLAGLFVLELLTSPPTPKLVPADESLGLEARLGLVHPPTVAQMVVDERAQIANEWSEAMRDYVPGALQALLAEALQECLEADEPER
eukprot:jgi/Chrpa1/18998/Chrysochromulina_OHIO_Genome00006673-RA